MSTLIVNLGEREKMEGRRAKVSGLKVGTGLHLLMLRGSSPCLHMQLVGEGCWGRRTEEGCLRLGARPHSQTVFVCKHLRGQNRVQV